MSQTNITNCSILRSQIQRRSMTRGGAAKAKKWNEDNKNAGANGDRVGDAYYAVSVHCIPLRFSRWQIKCWSMLKLWGHSWDTTPGQGSSLLHLSAVITWGCCQIAELRQAEKLNLWGNGLRVVPKLDRGSKALKPPKQLRNPWPFAWGSIYCW